MLPNLTLRKQIENFTARGNQFLSEASTSGNQEAYEKAIQEFVSSYKHALLLNSSDGTERTCAFNLGAAHVAGGNPSRGIDVLLTVLDQGNNEKNEKKSSQLHSDDGDIYFNLAIGHERLKQTDKALECYNKALIEYCKENKNQSKLPETHLKLANAYLAKNEYLEAQRNFSAAVRLYKELGDFDNAIMALVCQASAAVSDLTVSRDQCVRLLENCCKDCSKLNNVNLQGKVLCEVGLQYSTLGHTKHALACFEASIQLYDKNTNLRRRAIALQNAGALLNTIGRYRDSISYHAEAAQIHGRLGNRNAQGQSFCNLAFAKSQLAKYEDAGEAFLHALQAFKDTDDKQGQWQTHEGLGAIGFLKGNLEKAEKHFKAALKAQALAKNIDAVSQERIIIKLTNVLQSKPKMIHTLENRLSIKSCARERSVSPNPSLKAEDFLPELNQRVPEKHLRPRSRQDQMKRKSYRRGRRRYGDEDERPLQHVARGLSNITQSSDAAKVRVEKEEDSDSDFSFPFKIPFIDDSSSDYEMEDEEKEKPLQPKNSTQRGHLQSMVEASTTPINVLTAKIDDDQPVKRPPRKFVTKRHPKYGKHKGSGLLTNEDENGLEIDETRQATPRSDLSSSSEANMTQVYRKQLSEIHENSNEDGDSSSITTVSSETSEEETTIKSPKPIPRTSPPKPPRNKANAHGSDKIYQNVVEPVYAQSMKSSLRSNGSQSLKEGATSTHLYESIKMVKISEEEPESAVLESSETVHENSCDVPRQEGILLEGEDEAPLLSSNFPSNPVTEISLDFESENQSSSGQNNTQEDDPVFFSTERRNMPLPSTPTKYSKQKKNKASRACVIM